MRRCVGLVSPLLVGLLWLGSSGWAFGQIPLRSRPANVPGLMNNFNPSTSMIPRTAANLNDTGAILRDLVRANSYNAFTHSTPFGPAGVPSPIINGSATQSMNPYHYTWTYNSPYAESPIVTSSPGNVPAPATYGMFPNSNSPFYYNLTNPVQYTPPVNPYYNYVPYFKPNYGPFGPNYSPFVSSGP